MFKIAWKEKAFRQLRKVRNQHDKESIYEAVGALQNWPDCRNIKSLVNHEHGYRLRIGRYRVLFDVDTAIKIIEIQEVKKRDESTY